MLKIKSVYDAIKKDDGLRILCTRFRGRGLKKSRYNCWMANLGPSERLLKDFQNKKISWNEFKKKYKTELYSDSILDKTNKTIKNHGQKFTLRMINNLSKKQNITLMCHCNTSEQMCHVKILKGLILK